MKNIGYILNGPNGEVERWGGAGYDTSIPNPIFIKEIDVQVHAPSLGEIYPGYTLEEWEIITEDKLPDLAPWQFRAMLALSGKESSLVAFLEALPEPNKTIAKAKLEYTLVFHRDNDLVLAAQQALGLTKEQLDAMWMQAASL